MRILAILYLIIFYLALGVVILESAELWSFSNTLRIVAGDIVLFTLPLFLYLNWRYLRAWGRKYSFKREAGNSNA